MGDVINDIIGIIKSVFKRKEDEDDIKDQEDHKNCKECKNWLEHSIANKDIKSYEFSHFKNGQPIGKGSVVRADFGNNGDVFALKSFNNDEKTLYKVVSELKLHQNIVHYNILKFYGVTRTGEVPNIIREIKNEYILVLEYADSGTLNTYLEKYELDWNDKLRLALQLASVVSFLHDKNIVRRCLHGDNILVHNNNIKLADGLSKESGTITTLQAFRIMPYVDPRSMDPNENHELDQKSDVYSIGVLLWQISSRRKPFRSQNYNGNLAKDILKGKRETIVDGTPEEYSRLYTKCWNGEPNERPDMKQVVTTLNQLKLSDNFQDQNNCTVEWKNGLYFIPLKDLKNPEPLGKGGFGRVTKATCIKTGNYVVYKRKAFINEIRIHSHLVFSDRIARFLGISQDEITKEDLLVMEYANGGDLKNYLKNNFERLNWNDKKKLAYQIADGLNYLHLENILHGDLHSKNIIIHDDNAKICDFGFSKFKNQNSSDTGNFGIIAYMDPKRIFDSKIPYTEASDIYSFGVLMWEISSGYPPFRNISDRNVLAHAIKNGRREDEFLATPKEYGDLYKSCWNQEPEQRPIISEVLKKFAEMGFSKNEGKNEGSASSTNNNLPDSGRHSDLHFESDETRGLTIGNTAETFS